MPKSEGYVYGAQGNPNADNTFKPGGEPDNRDKRGSIEGSGVPGSPESAGYPAEPDQAKHAEPHGGLSMGEVIRRATGEKAQPIDKPIANPDITGGSAEARPVEPGV